MRTITEERLAAHLLLDVIERIWRVDREANEDNMGVLITEGSETIELLLTNGVPQR